jgi:hypothetical protein
MKTIERLSSSSTALAHRARKTIDATSSLLPQWLGTGAALTLARTGTKVATTFVRRNPAAALAIGVVGAGVLAYRMYRRRAADAADGTAQAVPGLSVEVPAVRKTTRRTAAKPKPAPGGD